MARAAPRRYVARVDTKTWPLSAAATQVLLDHERSSKTTASVVGRLALKELVVRGAVRVTRIEAKKRRKTKVGISTTSLDTRSFPTPLPLLRGALPETVDGDLAKAIQKAIKKDSQLFRERLRDEANRELVRRGLIEEHERHVLLIFPKRWVTLTKEGVLAAEAARAAVARAEALEVLAVRDVAGAAREAEELGIFVLLVPTGLGTVAKISKRRRSGEGIDLDLDLGTDDDDRAPDGSSSATGSSHSHSDHSSGPDPVLIGAGVVAAEFSILAAVDGAFEEAFADDGFDAVTSFGDFDSAFASIDSSIDSSMSDGGGDGGSGGDGGGGGCGGGGCGGS